MSLQLLTGVCEFEIFTNKKQQACSLYSTCSKNAAAAVAVVLYLFRLRGREIITKIKSVSLLLVAFARLAQSQWWRVNLYTFTGLMFKGKRLLSGVAANFAGFIF